MLRAVNAHLACREVRRVNNAHFIDFTILRLCLHHNSLISRLSCALSESRLEAAAKLTLKCIFDMGNTAQARPRSDEINHVTS